MTYAGPVGVLLGAITAFMTFFYVTLRNARMTATTELMAIYNEFWSDTYLNARRWIAIDVAYEELAQVLKARQAGASMGHLSNDEYAVLEELDRFLVIFVRIEHLMDSVGARSKRAKHIRDFVAYWRSMILARPELAGYVRKNWPILTAHDNWHSLKPR